MLLITNLSSKLSLRLRLQSSPKPRPPTLPLSTHQLQQLLNLQLNYQLSQKMSSLLPRLKKKLKNRFSFNTKLTNNQLLIKDTPMSRLRNTPNKRNLLLPKPKPKLLKPSQRMLFHLRSQLRPPKPLLLTKSAQHPVKLLFHQLNQETNQPTPD